MKENRTNPRFKIELNVIIKGINRDFKAHTVDLSLNGIFLKTTQKFPIASFVEMIIEVLPLKQNIEVLGKIIHKRAKIGVGIEFIEYAEGSKEILKSLVEFNENLE